ncbi:MAG: cytochrome P450 [Bacteroidota bacterium]
MGDNWRPTNLDFISNPQPYYAQLRKNGPVFQAKTGDYVILGYDACKQVLLEPSCKSGLQARKMSKIATQGRQHGLDLSTIDELLSGMLIQLNEPNHGPIRAALAKAWPKIAEIKEISEKSIHRALANLPNTFDAVNDLCKQIPITVISHFLGLDAQVAKEYAQDGLKVVQALDPYFTLKDLKDISKSSQRLRKFIQASLTTSSAGKSRLAESIREHTSEAETVSILAFLFIAGFETTSTLLTSCFYQLLTAKQHNLQVEESTAVPFVREVLRVYSPVQITGRYTTRELQVGGLKIPENSVLTICVGAANTDPDHFDQPLSLNLRRTKSYHLSFGYGIHRCLGAQLAEIEASTFVKCLVKKVDRMKLLEPPKIEKKLAVRSYRSMKVGFK